MREYQATGLEHLALVTELLHAARLANPTGGDWEAADLQWSWRRDQHPDPRASTFWLDDDRPAAAIVFTDWGDNFGCQVLDARHDSASALRIAGTRFTELLDTFASKPTEMEIRGDDRALIDAASAAGFVATDEVHVGTMMPASARAPMTALPDGFVVSSYAERADRPHHMVARSGEHVAARLGECAVYRPDLDLCIVETATDAVAAYGLFWADTVTGVGLVEPMRTEDAFQGRGLASAVLRAGLDRLAEAGCSTLKIYFVKGNEPARRAYLGAGFVPQFESRTYRRAAG
ncbi:MAG TPA: GNAT family N-acetyltransferase [Acidimicrobiia bacterium]|jgi:GNAT superfamily N-acetyltransferase|nr:GNAT family N-acetyltransferase [Acidimicrobiia bacterium]